MDHKELFEYINEEYENSQYKFIGNMKRELLMRWGMEIADIHEAIYQYYTRIGMRVDKNTICKCLIESDIVFNEEFINYSIGKLATYDNDRIIAIREKIIAMTFEVWKMNKSSEIFELEREDLRNEYISKLTDLLSLIYTTLDVLTISEAETDTETD